MRLRLYDEVNDEPDVVVEGSLISICKKYTTEIVVDGIEVAYVTDFHGAIHFRSNYSNKAEYYSYLSMEITE